MRAIPQSRSERYKEALMKKRKLLCILTALFCAVTLILSACSPAGGGSDTGTTDNAKTGGDVNPPATSGTRIRFDFDGQTVYGTLDDNSVSRDLISRLPLTLTFSDYSGTEKIAYLPDGSPAWDTSDAPDSCTPEVGQIAMYAPWGNLSVFYHSFRQSSGLIPLGKLDEGGAEKFAAMTGDFTVTISLSDDAPVMKEYTVTFDSDGGSAVEPQKVYEGNPIKRTVVPTKEGFHFLGWYRDVERTVAWNFDTDHVTSDLTLYAGWEAGGSAEYTASLVFALENGTYTVTGVGEESAIVIPAVYNGLPVTKIQGLHGNGAFAGKSVVSVVIPDSVAEIGQNTFYGCSVLHTVTIGENSALTIIGNNAFSGATALTEIYLPKGVTSIGSSAFNNCGGLNTITVASENAVYSSQGNNLIEKSTGTLLRGSNTSVIPESVRVIGAAAFRRSSIETITIPASVETIENYAFDDCTYLSAITVAAANPVFASLDGVLYNKNYTELLTAPAGITGEILLPVTLKEIPMFAFDGRSKLTGVSIPEHSVESIDHFAFRGTTLTIRYGGTKAEWEAVEKASEWGGNGLSVSFAKEDSSAVTAKKVLVVYFSYSGNTETVAKLIAGESGATLVEIVPTIPYTAADTNYNDSSSRSQVERRNDARPEIADATYAAIDMSKYDVVIIGYPIWNGYEPMIIRTFIEHYTGLVGKEVYTFSTSASSGGSTAFQSIKSRCPSADVKENLHFTRSALSSAENMVDTKLKEWGLSEGEKAMPGKIRMRFGGQSVTVTLVDNSATRDLVERLKQAPMTIDFSDFGGSEKIGYPSPALDVSDAEGCDPDVGDLTIYTPWGNLAAFYRDTAGYSESLVLIGRIDGDGIAILAAQSGTFSVTIELIQ